MKAADRMNIQRTPPPAPALPSDLDNPNQPLEQMKNMRNLISMLDKLECDVLDIRKNLVSIGSQYGNKVTPALNKYGEGNKYMQPCHLKKIGDRMLNQKRDKIKEKIDEVRDIQRQVCRMSKDSLPVSPDRMIPEKMAKWKQGALTPEVGEYRCLVNAADPKFLNWELFREGKTENEVIPDMKVTKMGITLFKIKEDSNVDRWSSVSESVEMTLDLISLTNMELVQEGNWKDIRMDVDRFDIIVNKVVTLVETWNNDLLKKENVTVGDWEANISSINKQIEKLETWDKSLLDHKKAVAKRTEMFDPERNKDSYFSQQSMETDLRMISERLDRVDEIRERVLREHNKAEAEARNLGHKERMEMGSMSVRSRNSSVAREFRELSLESQVDNTATGKQGNIKQSQGNISQTYSSNNVKLERLKLPTFSGNDISQFRSWQILFNQMTENEDDFAKLLRLRKAVEKPASDKIANIHNFGESMARLEMHYGSKYRIVQNARKELENHPTIGSDMDSFPSRMVSFHDLLTKIRDGLKIDKNWSLFASIDTISCILRKLEGSIQLEYSREVMTLPDEKEQLEATVKFFQNRKEACLRIMEGSADKKKAENKKFEKRPVCKERVLVTTSDCNAAKNKCKNKKDEKKEKALVAVNNQPSKCVIPGCKFTFQHPVFRCKEWKMKLNPDERLAVVLKNKLCCLCLQYHQGNICLKKNDKEFNWKCQKLERGVPCNQLHNNHLHGAKNIQAHSLVTKVKLWGQDVEAVLPAMYAPCQDKEGKVHFAAAIFDTCSTRAFIQSKFAEEIGFKKYPVSLSVTGIGSFEQKMSSFCYVIPMVTDEGNVTVFAVGLPEISEDLPRLDSAMFPDKYQHMVKFRPTGPVQLLFSLAEQTTLFPVKVESQGKILLTKSPMKDNQGNNFILSGGIQQRIKSQKEKNIVLLSDAAVERRMFDLSEFFAIEQFRSCVGCSSCQICSLRSRTLNNAEREATEAIEKKMRFDEKRKVWIVQYPWKIENYQERIGDKTFQMALSRGLNLERKLTKNGLAAAAAEVIGDMQERGVIKKVEDLPFTSWKAHIPLDFVEKEDSHTTKVRPTMDASAKTAGKLSVNECLYKGSSFLTPVQDSILRFRTKKVGSLGDLSKAYQHLEQDTAECGEIVILWRDPEHFGKSVEEVPFQLYGICRVSFGFVPAGSQLALSLRKSASEERNKQKYPEACSAFHRDFVVDDLCSSHENEEKAKLFVEQCQGLAAECGQSFKEFTLSGEKEKSETHNGKILGVEWLQEEDVLKLSGRANLTAKRRGKRIEHDVQEDLVPEDVQLSKRLILRALMCSFDPLGISSPFLLFLRSAYRKIEGSWDEPLDEEQNLQWIQNINKIRKLEVIVPRAVWSDENNCLELLATCDASSAGFACAFWVRAKNKDGTFESTLMFSKSRVIPKGTKLTIPRLELMSASLMARAMVTIVRALDNVKISMVYKMSDSTAVLGWIKSGLAKNDFEQYRICEIKRADQFLEAQNVPSCWLYVPSEFNGSDTVSRGTDSLEYLKSPSWVRGPKFWREDEFEDWPTINLEKALQMERKADIKEEMPAASQEDISLVQISSFPTCPPTENSDNIVSLQTNQPDAALTLELGAKSRSQVWAPDLGARSGRQLWESELETESGGHCMEEKVQVGQADELCMLATAKQNKKFEGIPFENILKKNFSETKFFRVTALCMRAIETFKGEKSNKFTSKVQEESFDNWSSPRSCFSFNKNVDKEKVIKRPNQGQKLEIGKRKMPILSAADILMARQHWNKLATITSADIRKFKNIRAYQESDLVLVRPRTSMLMNALDKIVVIQRDHPFTYHALRWAHENNHESDSAAVVRSRQKHYVEKAKSSMKIIRKECYHCKRERMKWFSPQMGQIHPKSVPTKSVRAFQCVHLDLAGYFWIYSEVKQRVAKKCFILVLRDSCFPVLHCEAMPDLSLRSFCGAFTRFQARRGVASFVFCDNGSQLRSYQRESGEGETWDFQSSQVQNLSGSDGPQWEFAKPYRPDSNGLSEGAIHSYKGLLQKALLHHKLTFSEFTTLLAVTEWAINNRPLYINYHQVSENFETADVLTGNVLLGIASNGDDRSYVEIKRDASINKRIQQLNGIAQQFWDYWHTSEAVWNAVNKSRKWQYSEENEAKAGDICWMKGRRAELNKVGQFTLCRILSLGGSTRHAGPYSCTVEYKLAGSKTWKTLHNVSTRNLAPLVSKDDDDQDKDPG